MSFLLWFFATAGFLVWAVIVYCRVIDPAWDDKDDRNALLLIAVCTVVATFAAVLRW